MKNDANCERLGVAVVAVEICTDVSQSRKALYCLYDSTSKYTRALHRQPRCWSGWLKRAPMASDQ